MLVLLQQIGICCMWWKYRNNLGKLGEAIPGFSLQQPIWHNWPSLQDCLLHAAFSLLSVNISSTLLFLGERSISSTSLILACVFIFLLPLVSLIHFLVGFSCISISINRHHTALIASLLLLFINWVYSLNKNPWLCQKYFINMRIFCPRCSRQGHGDVWWVASRIVTYFCCTTKSQNYQAILYVISKLILSLKEQE